MAENFGEPQRCGILRTSTPTTFEMRSHSQSFGKGNPGKKGGKRRSENDGWGSIIWRELSLHMVIDVLDALFKETCKTDSVGKRIFV